MGIASKLRDFSENLLDKLWQKHRLRCEIKKYRDKRRVDIYSSVSLTEEQKRKIDNLYKENYGKRIPHTWHRHYTAFTGTFDEYYFPEMLYIPEFEHFMNEDKHYPETFSDKNMLSYFTMFGATLPKTYLSRTAGLYKDENGNPITKEKAVSLLCNIGAAFCKPTVDTNSGKGCMAVELSEGFDKKSGKDIAWILDQLGDDFSVQEIVKCHDEVKKLHPSSCNTFRIITYRWKDEFYSVPAIIRIGRHGNQVDNAHAGGIFVAVDDDGTLHKTAFTEFNEQFTSHPDTGVVFEGYKISGFPACREMALKLHKAIPQVGIINWDFTIGENNLPILIESNMLGGGIWVVQMAHGKAPFGERTAEILRWISKMEKLPKEKRKDHKFGKI